MWFSASIVIGYKPVQYWRVLINSVDFSVTK